MGYYYGFSAIGQDEREVWFYHEESAKNFAIACGVPDLPVETTDEVNIADILDTPYVVWTVTP